MAVIIQNLLHILSCTAYINLLSCTVQQFRKYKLIREGMIPFIFQASALCALNTMYTSKCNKSSASIRHQGQIF